MKYAVIIFAVWLVFTVLGYGAGMYVFDSSDLDHLAEKGVGVYGRVTGKEPENHALINYSYQVNGKNYQGKGSAGRGNPDFKQIQIGQEVIVYYDPENPENAVLGYPQFYSRANRGAILFSTLFMPFFPLIMTSAILFIYWNATKKTGER